MARKPTGNPNGRPPTQIDKSQFEGLCKLFCTKTEIASWFGVHPDTLNEWCKREYGETFSAVYEQKKEGGKISLRRTLLKQAEKSAAVAIFLAKNHLGMKDEQAIEHKGETGIRIINDIPKPEAEDGNAAE